MSPMLTPRRNIILSLYFWLLILALASLGGLLLAIKADFSLFNLQVLGICFLTFAFGSFLILYEKIHSPLQKVAQEMKFLLSGQNYKRIYSQREDEVATMAHFFNEVTKNLENISQDVESHQRIKKELNTAQMIQQELLPTNPPKVEGLEIAAKTRPASEIGGDTFDFFQKGDRLFSYIGDSTGHGIPAGIVMIMVDTLLETFMDLQSDPIEIMNLLNRYLKPHLRPTMFITMALLDWDASKNTMHWVGAGHEHIVHFRPSSREIQSIPVGGIAIGMLPDNRAQLKTQEIVLQTGDFLVLYSDGITEAKNPKGEIYGLTRLKEYIATHTTESISPQELFEGLVIDVGRFMEGHPQEDDMTLLIFKKL